MSTLADLQGTVSRIDQLIAQLPDSMKEAIMSVPDHELDEPSTDRYCYECQMFHAPHDPSFGCYDMAHAIEEAESRMVNR